MMKSDELKASARNNTEKDFEFAYFDNIDDALIEGLNQNQDFFTLLLQNSEVKPIVDEIIDHVKNAIGYEEEKGKGKTCIIIALISVVISLVVLFVNISSQSSGY